MLRQAASFPVGISASTQSSKIIKSPLRLGLNTSRVIRRRLTTSAPDQLVSTQGFNTLGWMAVGFGTQMPNTPIVVTWPNADGAITLSQRQAAGHVMPTLVANPAQVATLAWGNSILATNTNTIAFPHPLPATLNAGPMI